MCQKVHVKGFIAGFVLWLLTLPVWAAPARVSYETAAEHLASSLSERDTSVFDASVDSTAILNAAFAGLTLDEKWASEFRSGLKLAIETRLGAKFVSQMPEGAYAKVLRVKPAGADARALLRLDYGDSGTGYLDFYLRKAANDKVRIVDWYDYSSGQLYSESLRQLIGLMSPTPTVLGKVFDVVSNRKDSIDTVAQMIKLNGEKKHAQMARKFLALDEDLRRNRMLNIIAVQAASMADDEELYRKTLANLDRYFSADPTMAFLLLDYYFLEERYDSALAALDKVRISFGVEDASLLVFKANTLAAQGKRLAAAELARRAIELEPEYELSYWSLLTALVQERQFARAVTIAKTLEEDFGYDLGPETLAAHETYLEFIASAEYKQWRNAP